MKIEVEADRLHEVITKAVDLKHQFENNSKLYEMASYITANLSSLWFNGTQEVEQAKIREDNGITDNDREWADREIEKHQDSLNDTMEKLKEAANNWKPNYKEGCIRLEEAYHKQAVHEELNNKYIIIEILNMLIEHGREEAPSSSSILVKAKALKAKVVGDK